MLKILCAFLFFVIFIYYDWSINHVFIYFMSVLVGMAL